MSDDTDRALEQILFMMPAGISTAELDVLQYSFNADAVDVMPKAAYMLE